MHINVSHILAGEVGDSADFDVKGENPDIPDLELAQPITGKVTVMKLDDGLKLDGWVRLAFGLECQRCLDPYDHEADLTLSAILSLKPQEDEWPISNHGEVDLGPIVREEALVSIPVRQLCREDCQGLCVDCGKRLADGHKHALQDVGHKPRIKSANYAQDVTHPVSSGTKRKDSK